MIIQMYPGPTENNVTDTDEIKYIIDRVNNEKKTFSGFNFESGGWVISIEYNHKIWFISDYHIVVNNLQYSVSSSLLTDLKIMVEKLSDY